MQIKAINNSKGGGFMKKTALRAKRRKIKFTFAARRFCRGGYQPPAFFGRIISSPTLRFEKFMLHLLKYIEWANFISHCDQREQYFTIHVVNYFTFGGRRIFH